MDLAALLLALLASVAIIAIGARFLLAPRQAMLGYGVAPDNLRALTEIKGVRDITSGVVMFVVWAAASRTALGWALVAVSITPIADALIVRTTGSPPHCSSPRDSSSPSGHDATKTGLGRSPRLRVRLDVEPHQGG